MKFMLPSMIAVLAVASAACGPGGSGGSSSTGGTGGSGNAAGTGGTGGSGNAAGTGGTGGSGNAAGTGGSGNAAGTGGVSGSSGSGGAGGCRQMADCDSGEFCAVYTLPPLCGGMEDTTFVNDCMTDADCTALGADQICVDKLCVFPHGGAQVPLHCRAGCNSDPDCGPGLACNAAHHCEPASCSAAADCGANFACDAGKCAPKPCSSDADCGNYCVFSQCSQTIGVCQPAVP